MKNKTHILIAFIFWVIATLLLVCSVIGMLLFIRTDGTTTHWQGDDGISTWNRLGLGLINELIRRD